ncbi:MAG: NAD(P)/FAD-dependent oxidoreductase [Oscillatoria sp. PMC 1068.18]|nr:NAD(P)/FAD-dependent oxidoreductase [Oscillatoria sp. PMC 1076.18]MEC4989415.1 NAD(P)/FAD-dependent oxidoreductase [Oscillatoria sp. PMC 1068.18]
MKESRTPRVVIIGAGFAGLKAAQLLGNSNLEITLIDRHNYHTFIPLLYQVATAQLSPEQISYPISQALRKYPNVRFLIAEVERIDFTERVVQTEDSAIAYDYLIIATGSQAKYLGVPGAADYTLGIRTLPQALELRSHLLTCFEQAQQEQDQITKQHLLTFIIIGGGTTGVELAGGISELIRDTLVASYPKINFQEIQIILIQSGDSLLSKLPKNLAKSAEVYLRKLGMKVHLNTKVSAVTPYTVHLEDDTQIEAGTIIWTAGIEAAKPKTSADIKTAAKEKIVVLSTLQLPKYPEVYAVGDVAYFEQNDQPLIGVAQVALQQGKAAAENILLQLQENSPKPFIYNHQGRAAIIARNAGVAKINKLSLTGFWGWLLWSVVHLYYLPGKRNKAEVLLTWIFDYFRVSRRYCQILPLENEAKSLDSDYEDPEFDAETKVW